MERDLIYLLNLETIFIIYTIICLKLQVKIGRKKVTLNYTRLLLSWDIREENASQFISLIEILIDSKDAVSYVYK